MKPNQRSLTTLVAALLGAANSGMLLFGQAGQVYRSDNFLSNPGAAYTINGPATFNNPGGLRVTGGTAASVISTTAIPVYAPNVQVTGVVTLTSSGDTGTYVVYARASSNALYGPSTATGTFLALVVQANATSTTCSTTWTLLKKGAAGIQNLWTGTVDCLSDNYQIIPELVSRDGNLYVYL